MGLESNDQKQSRFFDELARRLNESGIQSKMLDTVLSLTIFLGDIHVCDVKYSGDTYGNINDPKSPETEELFHQTARIASMVKEYMSAMENAPPLKASSLDPADGYRILVEYNGYVLAGRYSNFGCMFNTWKWDYQHKALQDGHYADQYYEDAKMDFVIRSGLVDRFRIFSDEDLTLIHKALLCYPEKDQGIPYDEEKLCDKLIRDIEYALPELEQAAPEEAPLEKPSM